jgi:hypothetical protein
MTKSPLNPYLVLAIGFVLPGVGQVVNRQPLRGLICWFFMLLLGAFTLKTAGAEVSLVGKLAGGLFVWAMSLLDAYKVARIRHAVWQHGR